MGHNARGALLALLAFGVFATHDAVIKYLGGAYSPFQLIFFSVLFSFPLAMGMLIGDQRPGTLRPLHAGWVAARTLAAVVNGITAFYAFSVLPLAQVYAILFASPLIITILAIPILGETVRIRRWIAVLVGLAGVLVVIRPGEAELQPGHAAAVASAFAGAFASIVVRKIGQEERPVVLLLYPMVANFLLVACLMPFVYRPMPVEHLGLTALIAILGWTAGLIIIRAYRSGEAVVVAPMQYSQILWASLYGFLFFDERISGMTALGAGIIIASGLYILLRERGSGASQTQPVLSTRMRPEPPGTSPRPSLMARLAQMRQDPR